MAENEPPQQFFNALTPPSTPPTPNPNHLSDVFSDSPPRSPTSLDPRSTDPSDIPRLRSTHSTAGYRAGISDSKEVFLQAGFDEGYSLGATFGLRVGYLLGVLEGLSAILSSSCESPDGTETKRSKRLFEEARKCLTLERVFAPELWGEDGVWKYEVSSGGRETAREADVTFRDVVEWHPVISRWAAIVEIELQKAGINKEMFEGPEWEEGRITIGTEGYDGKRQS